MGIPAIQMARIGSYIIKKKLTGQKRYPLVLMLEPLFKCNLRCKGCGKIDFPPEVMDKMLSVEQCLSAVEECGAPVVSIPGGEPLLHPDITAIVKELTARKKFVYLCTNALLAQKRIEEFTPSNYLTFNVHLDGLRDRHDQLTGRKGTFDNAVDAIKQLVAKGFRVTTNSTFFNDQDPVEAAKLFDLLTSLNVEGMTISAGFNYEKASDQDNFLERENTKKLFQAIFAQSKGRGWVFNHSSLYLDFLVGNQDYQCSPWGNPTYNIFGWQTPCYLLDDGYMPTYKDLMEKTDWDKYGNGHDPRCSNCMVHCGYEPTAVDDSVRNPFKLMFVKPV